MKQYKKEVPRSKFDIVLVDFRKSGSLKTPHPPFILNKGKHVAEIKVFEALIRNGTTRLPPDFYVTGYKKEDQRSKFGLILSFPARWIFAEGHCSIYIGKLESEIKTSET